MNGSKQPNSWLSWILIAEVLVHWLANAPTWLSFPAFAFGDLGASLTIQDLVARGERPGVDFAHHYGLLPLVFGRVWFGLFGATPLAFYLAMGLIEVWMARSLSKVAQACQVGWTGSTLLVVGLPFFVQSCYPNLAHGLEAGLLCQGLAEQARGRRGVALALATLAVLAKPSLGLVYGLVLILVSLRGPWSIRAVFGFDGLGPALVTGLVSVGALSYLFGVESVVRTILPLAGMATYKAGGFGFFFGSGRDFWWPKGVGFGYYLGTAAGFWLMGSLTLTLAGLVAIIGLWARILRRAGLAQPSQPVPAGQALPYEGKAEASVAALLVTCAAVHLIFVFELFGHSNTWVYDSYILGAGLAVLPSMGRAWRGWTWVLIVLALVGLKTTLIAPIGSWRTLIRTPETAGLWCNPQERAEWIEVRGLVKGQGGVALLSTSGCAQRFYPDLNRAEGVFFVAGLENEPEVARKARQIAGSDWVIVPRYLDNERLALWPAFAASLKRFEVVHDGLFYRVYQKTPGDQ